MLGGGGGGDCRRRIKRVSLFQSSGCVYCWFLKNLLRILQMRRYSFLTKLTDDSTADIALPADGIVSLLDFAVLSLEWSGDGIVAYWKFDETAGAVASDFSVNGYDGTLMNMDDSDWVAGNTGNALNFDGLDDYVEITGYQGVFSTQARTCAAWINTTATAGSIIAWGNNSSGNKWFLRVHSTGQLRIEVNGGYRISSTIVNDGNWTHVAAVLVDDGSPNVDEVKLYINGTEETVYTSVSQAISTTSGTNVSIGVALFNYPSLITPFTGRIDDVRIYDRALSDVEIATLAQ